MIATAEIQNETTVRGHNEHAHMCGRCGRVLIGADLLTMAECVEEEDGSRRD